MKILIIGVNGFIGAHAHSYFLHEGHELVGVATRGTGNSSLYIVDKFEPDFNPIFQEHQIDVCINASGSSGVGFSIREPEKDYQLNVGINRKLLSAIKQHAPQTKFIHLSSAAVYGNPAKLPISETTEANPISPYGHHKLQAEEICTEFNREYNIQTESLRIFSVYGPGLKKQLFWDIYQKSTKTNELELWGTGEETRDYIFIDDLMLAIEAIIQNSKFKNDIVNVANGVEVTIKEAAEILIQNLGTRHQINFNQQVRKGDPLNWCADTSKLREMGYKQSTSIHEGLGKLARWIGKI